MPLKMHVERATRPVLPDRQIRRTSMIPSFLIRQKVRRRRNRITVIINLVNNTIPTRVNPIGIIITIHVDQEERQIIIEIITVEITKHIGIRNTIVFLHIVQQII